MVRSKLCSPWLGVCCRLVCGAGFSLGMFAVARLCRLPFRRRMRISRAGEGVAGTRSAVSCISYGGG